MTEATTTTPPDELDGWEPLGALHLPSFEGDEDPLAADKVIDSLEYGLELLIDHRRGFIQSGIDYNRHSDRALDDLRWARLDQARASFLHAHEDMKRVCEIIDRFAPIDVTQHALMQLYEMYCSNDHVLGRLAGCNRRAGWIDWVDLNMERMGANKGHVVVKPYIVPGRTLLGKS